MTISTIINQYEFNLKYAKELVSDISNEQMSLKPSKGLDNHPAFTLGHLVSGSFVLLKHLNQPNEMPEKWDELFLRNGPGAPRKPKQNINYPKKEELLRELESNHNKVTQALLSLDQDQLNQPFQWRYSTQMPLLIDMITFMCINHESMHLGQLAAWRRALDMPSALAKLP